MSSGSLSLSSPLVESQGTLQNLLGRDGRTQIMFIFGRMQQDFCSAPFLSFFEQLLSKQNAMLKILMYSITVRV